MEVDALSAALAGSKLADYDVLRKIGGKDVTPGGMAATATMHGVCSLESVLVSRPRWQGEMDHVIKTADESITSPKFT